MTQHLRGRAALCSKYRFLKSVRIPAQEMLLQAFLAPGLAQEEKEATARETAAARQQEEGHAQPSRGKAPPVLQGPSLEREAASSRRARQRFSQLLRHAGQECFLLTSGHSGHREAVRRAGAGHR